MEENPITDMSGMWYTKEGAQYQGKLKFWKDYCVLEIIEATDSIDGFVSSFGEIPEKVYGTTDSGTKITVLNCKRVSQRPLRSEEQKNIIISTFLVKDLLKGIHLKSDKFEAKQVNVSFHNMEKWYSLSVFKSFFGKTYEGIKYKHSKGVKVKISETLYLEIYFNTKKTFGNAYITISVNPLIEFVSIQKRNIEEWTSQIRIAQEFFSFCMEMPTPPVKIIFPNEESKNFLSEIEYVNFVSKNSSDEIESMSHMDYNLLKPHLNSFLIKWFTEYKMMGPIIGLYNNNFDGTITNQEGYFLNIIFALEGFDRRTSTGRYLSEDRYEKIRAILAGAIPVRTNKRLKDALESKLKYGNEYSLRTRIKRMLSRLPKQLVNKVIEDERGFISKVVDTRNALVHVENSQDRRIFTEQELGRTNLILLVILKFMILKYYRVPARKAREIIEGSWQFSLTQRKNG